MKNRTFKLAFAIIVAGSLTACASTPLKSPCKPNSYASLSAADCDPKPVNFTALELKEFN